MSLDETANIPSGPDYGEHCSPQVARGNPPCTHLAYPRFKRHKKRQREDKRRTERTDNRKRNSPLHPYSSSSSRPKSSPSSTSRSDPTLWTSLVLFGSTLRPAKEAQDRLGAPLIRKQIPDFEVALPPSSLLRYLQPQGLLLRLPATALTRRCLSGILYFRGHHCEGHPDLVVNGSDVKM